MNDKEMTAIKDALDAGKELKQAYILRNLESAVCVMPDDESPKHISLMYLPYIYGGFYGRNFI